MLMISESGEKRLRKRKEGTIRKKRRENID